VRNDDAAVRFFLSSAFEPDFLPHRSDRSLHNETENETRLSFSAQMATKRAAAAMEAAASSEEKRNKMDSVRSLMWFRTDLRVQDNSALESAVQLGQPIVGLFVVSPSEWILHNLAPVKVEFMLRGLVSLQSTLASFNIPLLVRNASGARDVPDLVMSVCKEVGANHVFYNVEYEVDEWRRDKRVEALGPPVGVTVHALDDQCIIPPGRLETHGGKPYTVFTPYRRSWYVRAKTGDYLRVRHGPSAQMPLDNVSAEPVPLALPEYQPSGIDPTLWYAGLYRSVVSNAISSVSIRPASESAAHERLDAFAAKRILRYDADRNTPSVNGTSALSPYLAVGILSPRQCAARALPLNKGSLESGCEGIVTWISELIWRGACGLAARWRVETDEARADFYRGVLFSFPRVCMNQPFKMDTVRVQWRDSPEEFQRWCAGRTGYAWAVLCSSFRC
jgi:deoxyribodipyrimidine photo-lyase